MTTVSPLSGGRFTVELVLVEATSGKIHRFAKETDTLTHWSRFLVDERCQKDQMDAFVLIEESAAAVKIENVGSEVLCGHCHKRA